MKNSAVLASLLFGSFAVAAPVDKRALVTTTAIVTETVVVYTTIYDDEPAATSSEALFYQQPAQPTSAAAYPTSAAAAAYTPPAYTPSAYTSSNYTPSKVEPSSVYTPPPQVPSPTPSPSTEESKPTSTQQPYVASSPAPAASSAVSAPAPQYTPVSTNNNQADTGYEYQGVDITIYNGNTGQYGSCGTKIYDTGMTVALSSGLMGPSTYNVQTGDATNPWCGQKIQIEYQGTVVEATIQDTCPGCLHANDIDLTPAVWEALTGGDVITRYQASWTKMS